MDEMRKTRTTTWAERALWLCVPVVPALAVGMYWIWSLARGETLSGAAMYRYGDYNYFPWLAGIARFSVGESFVFERLGEGLRSFPFPSLALHGLAMGLLGTVGFVLADLVVAVAVYYAARTLLRNAGLSPVTSISLALVVACGLLGWPGDHLAQWLGWDPRLHLWGFRFPRPFLTDLFLLLCVGRCLRLVVERRDAVRDWAWLGWWFGLLLQSRFYTATTVGLVIALSMLYVVVRRRAEGLQALRGPGSFALVAGLAAVPFVFQRLLEHPDVPVRLGVFPVDRWAPKLLEGIGGDFLQAGLCTVLAVVLIRASGISRRRERLGAMLLVILLLAISSLALPISTILLGKTVEPYHFADEFVTFKTLVLVVGAGQIADFAVGWLSRLFPASTGWRRPAAGAWLLLVASACLLGVSRMHAEPIHSEQHARTGFPDYHATNYRQAFRDLTRELESDRYAGARVLATLDIQVLDWWSLFGGGQAFCPDPGATDISDDEIEARLLGMFRTLRVGEHRMMELIHDRAVMVFFLGCAKYQASSWHRFAPLDDYPEEVREASENSSPLKSWLLGMPNSEAQRLLTRYQHTPPVGDDLRLDLIVLGPGSLDYRLAPPPERFEPTFTNALFRVYRRRDSP